MATNRFLVSILLSSFLFTINSYAAVPWIEGVCSEIVDGDTIKVRLDIKPEIGSTNPSSVISWMEEGVDMPGVVAIRLSQIDAPELTQSYGSNARNNLFEKIFNKKIRIVEEGAHGSPGLMSARVWYYDKDNKWTDLNKLLVQDGMAWVDKFSGDEELKTLQMDAQKSNRGLFASGNPMTPWMFRGKKEKRQHKIPSFKNCAEITKSCRKMESCRQATYYLKTCGRTDLDPDRDGIPCENTVCGNRIEYKSTFDEEIDD